MQVSFKSRRQPAFSRLEPLSPELELGALVRSHRGLAPLWDRKYLISMTRSGSEGFTGSLLCCLSDHDLDLGADVVGHLLDGFAFVERRLEFVADHHLHILPERRVEGLACVLQALP